MKIRNIWKPKTNSQDTNKGILINNSFSGKGAVSDFFSKGPKEFKASEGNNAYSSQKRYSYPIKRNQ